MMQRWQHGAILAIVAGVAAAAPSQAARAQAGPTPPSAGQAPLPADPLARAEVLIARGRDADARAILVDLDKAPSGDRARDAQVQFLLALLDRNDRDYGSAIARLRRILVDDPKAQRVRLELGRTFFEAKDYASAERQFRYARAGKVPPEVVRNIDRYLYAIRQHRSLTVNVSFGATSDSNLNAGPATDTVTLYGLPFQLSQNAQATSGHGLVGDLSAEWAPRLASNAKFRIGGLVHRAQYGRSDFNDMTAILYVGPRLNTRQWEFNLLGSAGRRWYGDKPYSDQVGGSIDATWFRTSRFGLSLAFNLSHFAYLRNRLQSGMAGGLSLGAFVTPTAASFLRGTVQLNRQSARNSGYANTSGLAGLQYVREFKGGLTLGLMPSVTRIVYDQRLAAFDAVRKDTQVSAQASLLDRRLDFHGLTPKLLYTYTRNSSTLPLFRFARSKFDFVLTNSF